MLTKISGLRKEVPLCSEGAQPLLPAGRLQAEIVDVCFCALRNSVRANTHEIYHLNKVDLWNGKIFCNYHGHIYVCVYICAVCSLKVCPVPAAYHCVLGCFLFSSPPPHTWPFPSVWAIPHSSSLIACLLLFSPKPPLKYTKCRSLLRRTMGRKRATGLLLPPQGTVLWINCQDGFFCSPLRGFCYLLLTLPHFLWQFLSRGLHPKHLTFLRLFQILWRFPESKQQGRQIKSGLPVNSDSEYFCSVSMLQILHGTFLYYKIICSVYSICQIWQAYPRRWGVGGWTLLLYLESKLNWRGFSWRSSVGEHPKTERSKRKRRGGDCICLSWALCVSS